MMWSADHAALSQKACHAPDIVYDNVHVHVYTCTCTCTVALKKTFPFSHIKTELSVRSVFRKTERTVPFRSVSLRSAPFRYITGKQLRLQNYALSPTR